MKLVRHLSLLSMRSYRALYLCGQPFTKFLGPLNSRCHSRVTAFMECLVRSARLNVGGPDHLAPLFGFVRNELAEFGRR
ncbi:MAG: hypothetical protein WBD83_24680, partial [Xanthobacteraceae bacterium]